MLVLIVLVLRGASKPDRCSKSEGDPIVGQPGASATHQAIIRKGERQVQPAVGSHHEADESSEASSPLAGGAADGGAPTCCGTGRASSSAMSSELRHKSEQSVWKKSVETLVSSPLPAAFSSAFISVTIEGSQVASRWYGGSGRRACDGSD